MSDDPASHDYFMQELQAEIDSLRKQRDAMMLFVRDVADEVNALSTRPRDAIGFGDLVNTIQTWGDNANEILKEYPEST